MNTHPTTGIHDDGAPSGEPTPIDVVRLARALAVRDLSDPTTGQHALQHVVAAVERALADAWGIPVRHDPGERIVAVADNYDRLGYSTDAVTRDRRYSRYVGAGRMLRSHTTARIPALLDEMAAACPPPFTVPLGRGVRRR